MRGRADRARVEATATVPMQTVNIRAMRTRSAAGRKWWVVPVMSRATDRAWHGGRS